MDVERLRYTPGRYREAERFPGVPHTHTHTLGPHTGRPAGPRHELIELRITNCCVGLHCWWRVRSGGSLLAAGPVIYGTVSC